MAEQFDNGEDFDLSTLPDDELVEQVHDDLYNGLREEIVEATNILLGRGWSASRVLDEALVEGMRIVGVDFRDGILFVPEVLMAANAMKGGMEILHREDSRRQPPRDCGNDLEIEAAAEASRIEASFSDEALESLIRAKGVAASGDAAD